MRIFFQVASIFRQRFPAFLWLSFDPFAHVLEGLCRHGMVTAKFAHDLMSFRN